jgi:hypothetical protein
LGRAGFTAAGPVSKKFLRRFFQKAAIFFDLTSPGRATAPSRQKKQQVDGINAAAYCL